MDTVFDATSAAVLAAGAEFGAMIERLIRAEGGMTRAQFDVLRVVSDADEPLEPRDIAHALRLGSGHLTGVLDGLEHGGLVTRRRHGADGRRRLIAPTDEGRARLSWLRTLITAAEARVFAAALRSGERAVLTEMLTRVRTAITTMPDHPDRVSGP